MGVGGWEESPASGSEARHSGTKVDSEGEGRAGISGAVRLWVCCQALGGGPQAAVGQQGQLGQRRWMQDGGA